MRILSNKEYKDLINENEELTRTIISHYLKYSELQDKVNDAIEYIKENASYGIQEKCCMDDLNYDKCDELLEILGDKEQKEYRLTKDENGSVRINGDLYKVEELW